MADERTYPYTDTAMTYDTDDHRYILKHEYVLDKTGIDLQKVLNPGYTSSPQQLSQHFLWQISLDVYNWIYEHNQDNVYQEYLLAKHPLLRDNIKSALLEQVLYVIRNGDLTQYSGVNVKTGQIMDQRLLVQASIAPNAQRILSQIIPGVGVAITYQGQFKSPFGIKVREDY